jgi:hypothetical protein
MLCFALLIVKLKGKLRKVEREVKVKKEEGMVGLPVLVEVENAQGYFTHVCASGRREGEYQQQIDLREKARATPLLIPSQKLVGEWLHLFLRRLYFFLLAFPAQRGLQYLFLLSNVVKTLPQIEHFF